jgi:hypothetical protein
MNMILEKELEKGLGFEPTSVAKIRKNVLTLKQELRKLDSIEEGEAELELALAALEVKPVVIPSRKRVPLIPFRKQVR